MEPMASTITQNTANVILVKMERAEAIVRMSISYVTNLTLRKG